MDTNLLIFFLLGGVVYADTEAAGQAMVAQPLIACTTAGLLLGNMTLGMTVGLLMQLPYLIELPVGGAKVSLGNIGAYIAAGVAVTLSEVSPDQSNFILAASLLWGILLSWGLVKISLRRFLVPLFA